MSKKKVVISASARVNSNSAKLIQHLFGKNINHIELCTKQIAQYDYHSKYEALDDFQDIADEMLIADLIILFTPIYWYTMSGYMKVFMDRWTDLVTIHKEKGRLLKGKKIAVIAQSTSDAMPLGFEVPFKLTAAYMDMQYVGSVFWDMRRPIEEAIDTQHLVQGWAQ